MSEKKPSFSIVIAVRDQSDDLKANLPALLGQKYDSFEVVVVDEHSTDDSSDFLKQICRTEDRGNLLQIRPNAHFRHPYAPFS